MSAENLGRKCLLLAGVRPDIQREIGAIFEGKVDLQYLGSDDTLGAELFQGVDLILLDFSQGDFLARRIARVMDQSQVPITSGVCYLSDHTPSVDVMGELPPMWSLPLPLDEGYLLGALDTVSTQRQNLRKLGKEQVRINHLYEMSKSLLQVYRRAHISNALAETLPQVINSSLILLTFPASNQPILFLSARFGMTRTLVTALYEHLTLGWNALRPDVTPDWGWLESMVRETGGGDDEEEVSHSPNSFISIPINRGHQTDGFLTFHQGDNPPDESTHQTVLLVADLIAMLMLNLQLREELEVRATRDSLTGLLNRQTIFDQLEGECQRANRYPHEFSVVMFDIDHFKQVNDTYTHLGGDEVLRQVGILINEVSRETDMAGRFGGEEFIVVLPHTDFDGAKSWAERLRRAFEERPIPFEGKRINVTISVGVASLPKEKVTSDMIVARADAALYRAKKAGRNRVYLSVGEGESVPLHEYDRA